MSTPPPDVPTADPHPSTPDGLHPPFPRKDFGVHSVATIMDDRSEVASSYVFESDHADTTKLGSGAMGQIRLWAKQLEAAMTVLVKPTRRPAREFVTVDTNTGEIFMASTRSKDLRYIQGTKEWMGLSAEAIADGQKEANDIESRLEDARKGLKNAFQDLETEEKLINMATQSSAVRILEDLQPCDIIHLGDFRQGQFIKFLCLRYHFSLESVIQAFVADVNTRVFPGQGERLLEEWVTRYDSGGTFTLAVMRVALEKLIKLGADYPGEVTDQRVYSEIRHWGARVQVKHLPFPFFVDWMTACSKIKDHQVKHVKVLAELVKLLEK